jgi:uncharacterized protein (DUF433 family)
MHRCGGDRLNRLRRWSRTGVAVGVIGRSGYMVQQWAPKTRSEGTMADSIQRITIDPQICHGKPTVRGLRYPVEMVLEFLSAGMTHAEILGDYPDLEREDLLAVLAFAARLSRVKRVEQLAA